jgi:hypothetical protein
MATVQLCLVFLIFEATGDCGRVSGKFLGLLSVDYELQHWRRAAGGPSGGQARPSAVKMVARSATSYTIRGRLKSGPCARWLG